MCSHTKYPQRLHVSQRSYLWRWFIASRWICFKPDIHAESCPRSVCGWWLPHDVHANMPICLPYLISNLIPKPCRRMSRLSYPKHEYPVCVPTVPLYFLFARPSMLSICRRISYVGLPQLRFPHLSSFTGNFHGVFCKTPPHHDCSRNALENKPQYPNSMIPFQVLFNESCPIRWLASPYTGTTATWGCPLGFLLTRHCCPYGWVADWFVQIEMWKNIKWWCSRPGRHLLPKFLSKSPSMKADRCTSPK